MALSLFAVGVVEYVLAAVWTQVVVSKQAGATAAVTFVNVMMWGFVITSLEPGNVWLLVVHGLGCAIGAALACRITAWLPLTREDRREARSATPSPASWRDSS